MSELCVFLMSVVSQSAEVLVKLPPHLPLWPVSWVGQVMPWCVVYHHAIDSVFEHSSPHTFLHTPHTSTPSTHTSTHPHTPTYTLSTHLHTLHTLTYTHSTLHTLPLSTHSPHTPHTSTQPHVPAIKHALSVQLIVGAAGAVILPTLVWGLALRVAFTVLLVVHQTAGTSTSAHVRI